MKNFEEWRVVYDASAESDRNSPDIGFKKADLALNKFIYCYIADSETRDSKDGSQYVRY